MIVLDNIRQISGFSHLEDATLQWLVSHSREVCLEPGVVFRRDGDPAEHVFVLLEGEYWITQRVGNEEVLIKAVKAIDLFGEVPTVMGVDYFWASGHARTRCYILEVPNAVFWQLIGLCPTLATTIVRTATERLQEVQLLAQHRENLVSLGNMAAGLAHELNNPAAASRQAARQLREVFPVLQTLTLVMAQKSMLANQQGILDGVQQEAIARAQAGPLLDPLTQSDREDDVTDWLANHGITDGWRLSPTLVAAGLDLPWLDHLAAQLPGQCIPSVVTWLETLLTGAGLLDQLNHTTQRIFNIVEAVQDYSDQDAGLLQTVDVHDGLESTLTILHHKLRHSITVIRDYDPNLPRIQTYGTELNQVWTNLIDNAIDATQARFAPTPAPRLAEQKSHATLTIPDPWQHQRRSPVEIEAASPTIWIHTQLDGGQILVEIADNGIGILADVQPHIFEPFFTTKAVGQGTGIGLQIARRIIEHHQGHIHVLSDADTTRFQVRLPVQMAVDETTSALPRPHAMI